MAGATGRSENQETNYLDPMQRLCCKLCVPGTCFFRVLLLRSALLVVNYFYTHDCCRARAVKSKSYFYLVDCGLAESVDFSLLISTQINPSD